MKLFLRILLFVLCINTLSLNSAFATVVDVTADVPPENEVLEKNFVSIDLVADNTASISIVKSFNSIVKLVQANYYSLLNWHTYSRSPKNMEIPNYNRLEQFGRWINDPNDDTCYNTRAKVLVRDSDKTVIFKDTNHCVVDGGYWQDPYTDQPFTNAKDIQIDHLVPLKNAYMSGASKWSFRARCLYANYLGAEFHLISSNGTQNMKKGDKSPDKYMPPNPEYTCTYVKNWLSVKFLWGLKMTEAEAAAIVKIISDNNCNTQKMRMTYHQIMTQAEFAQDNADLCEKIDQASKPTTN
ncbi:MAG: HNH endonuclease family protein [Pseudobdellovibrio sp.]